MQQQINQMMLQIAAGAFGGQHLKEQKKQTKEKIRSEAEMDVSQVAANLYDITGAEEGSPLDRAFTIAQENLGKKDFLKRNAQAQKEFAMEVAKGTDLFKTPADMLTKKGTVPPTPPATPGDKGGK